MTACTGSSSSCPTHAVGYLEAYLEEKNSEAFQRELALLKKPKYREARMLIEHFKNLGLTEGRAEGRAEGARAQAIADARKFLEHGVSWEIITNVTGLKPKDLATK